MTKGTIMFFHSKNLFLIPVAAALLLWGAGCSNEGSGENEHAEARGLVLKMADTVVVSVDSLIVTGQLTFPANNQFSNPIAVWFIADDADRDEFRPDEEDELLNVVVADTSVASVLWHADATDPDEKWEFHVKGKTAGSTTIQVQIYHVDHPDYTSPAIPVVTQ
jgi:hypothetical protein